MLSQTNFMLLAMGSLVIFIATVLSCSSTAKPAISSDTATVHIKKTSTGYGLFVNGEEFYVKGAGGEAELSLLKKYGGNTIRTWGLDNAQEVLDDALNNGIMVTLGLWVQHERHGFDYDNEEAVAAQLEKFRVGVRKYKDHPALLMWAVGNEMELNASNMKMWNAVNDIAEMIKIEDPNHPTMTVIAEIGDTKLKEITERVPAIDALGVNSYAGLNSLPKRLREAGWKKPYFVTEWGPNGHWEVGKTPWGAPLEPNSTQKATQYRDRYENIIKNDSEMCLGSFVFLWGQKQERTPTWYGLFLKSGEKTPMLDVMAKVWSGNWPENRAPEVKSLSVVGKMSQNNIKVKTSSVLKAKVDVSDPDNDELTFDWFVLRESDANTSGGDAENLPDEMNHLIASQDQEGNLEFETPNEKGAYRLFVNVFDGKGSAGSANIPFFVE